MAARRYEISLLVSKKYFQIFFITRREISYPRAASSIYRIIGISTYSCIAIRDHTPCYWHNLAP